VRAVSEPAGSSATYLSGMLKYISTKTNLISKLGDIFLSYMGPYTNPVYEKSNLNFNWYHKFHHNEELRDLYSLLNIVRVVKSRRMRWVGHVARMGEVRGVHGVLVGKPEGKRPLGKPRRRWEDNIKMDLREVGGVETGWSWLRRGTDGGHL